MELWIDKAGRIIVPNPLRERLGFKPDTQLQAIEQPEGLLFKRVEQRASPRQVLRRSSRQQDLIDDQDHAIALDHVRNRDTGRAALFVGDP